MDMEDPFGPLPSTMAQSSASTSYTIMSPRAFSSSPLPPNLLSQKGSPAAVPTQEGGPKSASSNSPLTSSRPAGHPAFTTGTPLTTNMNVTSPSTIIRAVSPPTPAPSPQPDLGTHVHSTGPIASNATPSHPASILMAHSGSAAMGEPGTPVSPGTEDAQGLAWGDPNMHVHPSHFGEQDQAFHIDPEVQEAIFAEQFIQSVVSYFPRLTGPERRTLFTSLLPQMSGEDLLHLSNLISPYLRRDFLAELPAEISLKILGFIDDPKDLMRASRVSRTWRSLVADEHNWKLMLDKYNGGGWSEARPALAPSSVGLTNAPVGQFTSQGRSRGEAALSTGNVPSQRLANIAQASRSRVQEYRPSSYTAQNSFTGAQLPSAGKTLQPVEPEYEEEENVNRFLPENQTPLAGRTKKNKGKGRASDGNLDALASNRDLTAPGFSSAGMPGPSTSSSIVGLMPAMQQTPFDSNSTASVGSLHGLGVLPPRRGHSSMPYQTSPSAASVLASQQQQRSPAGRAMPGSYRPGPPLIFSRSHSAAPPQIAMPYPPPPQNLTSQLQQLSLASSAPNMLPTLSIPASTLSETQSASSQLNSSIASSAVSPSATFALAYASPAQFVTPVHASSGSSLDASGTPSVITSDQISLVASQRAHGQSEQHSQSAPQPARVRIAKSQNPFGTAQTNLSYTSQYSQNMQFSSNSTSSTSKPFSFKTQFKKAYLTESNWLKGPGRVLSRQTCTDDGVVTSLGFDNEWIIVGMATNQIHVFDAKTGAYVQQLVGHTLGVWCLVLVSKGGHKLDKEGKRVKSPKTDVEGMPSIFQTPGRTSWEAASDDDESSSSDDEEDGKERASPTMTRSSSTGFLRTDGMERTRSASARPADRETFFQEASESFISSPYLGVNDGSPQGRGNNKSTSQPRRPSSSGMPSSEPSKRRRSNKRPSSFCGVPSSDPSSSAQDGSSSSSAKFTSNPSGFPFGGNGTNISPQQAAACGTAQGWGQPGAVAVSGGCDRDVRVWDVATGVCIHVLRGHLSTVRCLKVLDGRPIAVSGSRDNTLRVWDIERGVLLKLLSGHHHSVRCIEISGNKVVSGSYDATCKIWDVDTGECLHTLQGHQHQIYAVAFDGNRVASGSLDSTVRIWSAKTGECLALLQGHTSLVGQLQLTDSLLVTGGSDGRVIVFSLSTFECLHRLCAHDNSVTCLQFNDRFMVTGGNDGRVKLWDRPTGKLIRDLAEPCEAVWRVTFREDKCVLLCKRGNRTIMEVRTFAPFDEEL